MKEKQAEGKCCFCNETFSKKEIVKHLDAHLSKMALTAKSGESFLVNVEMDPRWGAAPYFLQLWVDGATPLNAIGNFLRSIWLECCGHMSGFRSTHSGEISPDTKAKDIFGKETKLNYEYDFGSTTELLITIKKAYTVKAPQKIVLLSRNEPPNIYCQLCKKKPAELLCTVCEKESFFCKPCSIKHAKKCPDFKDYSSMPVVNSPRMGVCGYEGGSIDRERDGIFKK